MRQIDPAQIQAAATLFNANAGLSVALATQREAAQAAEEVFRLPSGECYQYTLGPGDVYFHPRRSDPQAVPEQLYGKLAIANEVIFSVGGNDANLEFGRYYPLLAERLGLQRGQRVAIGLRRAVFENPTSGLCIITRRKALDLIEEGDVLNPTLLQKLHPGLY